MNFPISPLNDFKKRPRLTIRNQPIVSGGRDNKALKSLNRNPTIVLVDEDEIQIPLLISELQINGNEVVDFKEADSCIRFAQSESNIDLFIVDIMLPSKEYYSDSVTRGFLYTGVFLARDIRKSHPETPILLISNHSDRESLNKIEKALDTIGWCVFLSKFNLPGIIRIADIAQIMIDKGIKGLAEESLIRKIWRCIILKPNINGIGFDFKEWFKSRLH
jgi:CheY-like chemotaxis protein